MAHLGESAIPARRTLPDSLQGVRTAIHCMGVAPMGSLLRASPERFNEVFTANVWTAVELLQKAKRGGVESVVLIGSISAGHASPGLSLYASSKAALRGLVRTAAKELLPMRVNLVEPARIACGMHDRAKAVSSAEAMQAFEAEHALGLIAPDEVVRLALEVARNPHMTGSVVEMSSGYGL